MSRLSTALAAVLTFGLAGVSLAAPTLTGLTVDGSVTAEGSVGAALTITGTELGTKAPKAALRLHGDATAKAIPLKLVKPFDGTTIHAAVVKCAPGVYDLVVSVKGSDAVTLDSAFTARAPQIDSLGAATIAPGDHVDINGHFFGTKKGKVTIGGVTAKVTLWSEGRITVVVSKKNQSGSATFDVFGKGGTQDDGASATVVAPIAGKDHVTITFDNGGAKLVGTDPVINFAVDGIGSYELHGAVKSGATLRQFGLFGIDKSVGVPHTGPLIAAYQGVAGFAPFNYDGTGFQWTTTITQRVGDRISGTFSGGLNKNIGGGAASYNVTGEFTVTLK